MATQTVAASSGIDQTTTFTVLAAISFCHLLNDMMQALLPAVYPLLKGGFDLSFGQIGLLSLTYQITASLLQPMIGFATDRRPMPAMLPVGMAGSMGGLVVLALAHSFAELLVGATLLGVGSAIFHPESSRIARAASGGRHGIAQSLFQVGGNAGTALGPLLAAFFVIPRGQPSLAWFAIAAMGGMEILIQLAIWYRRSGHAQPREKTTLAASLLSTGRIRLATCWR